MKMKHPPEKRPRTLCEVAQAQNFDPSCKSLGDDMIEHILSFLPIREGIQKSILAKRFEKSWQLSQHLCFDHCFSKDRSQIQVAEIIHRLLALHSPKKIITFELCVNPLSIEALIISWIKFAISKEPNVLHLDFMTNRFNVAPCKIPFELIDTKSIQVLRLSYCFIDLPPKFKDLQFLHTLVLRYIAINSSFIKTIVDNCSLLRSLDMVRCFDVRQLHIVTSSLKFFKELKIGDCYQLDFVYVDAPTLEIFHFVGKPYNVAFEGRMSQLKDVMLNFRLVSYILPRHHTEDLMWQISSVGVLTISSTLLEVCIRPPTPLFKQLSSYVFSFSFHLHSALFIKNLKENYL